MVCRMKKKANESGTMFKCFVYKSERKSISSTNALLRSLKPGNLNLPSLVARKKRNKQKQTLPCGIGAAKTHYKHCF